MLWQSFIAKFDGLDGFFECRFEERAEYLVVSANRLKDARVSHEPRGRLPPVQWRAAGCLVDKRDARQQLARGRDR